MLTLYHARRGEEPEQSALHPTKAAAQVRNGHLGQFLFATPRLDQAYNYAVPFCNSGFMSTLVSGDHTSRLLDFRDETSEKLRSYVFSNRIYSMSSEGFEPVTRSPREWISTQSKTDITTHVVVDHVDQVLSAGIQVFTLSKDAPPNHYANLNRDLSQSIKLLDVHTLSDWITNDPYFIWENERDGLGMDPLLARLVDEKRRALLGEDLGEAYEKNTASTPNTTPASENVPTPPGKAFLDSDALMAWKASRTKAQVDAPLSHHKNV